MGTSRSSTAATTAGSVDVGGRAGGRPAAVQDDDVDAAEGLDGGRHEPLEIGGDGEVAGPRARRSWPPHARRHRPAANIATFAPFRGERLGDGETHPLRGAQHDRAAALKSEIHGARSVPGGTVHVAQRSEQETAYGVSPCSSGDTRSTVVRCALPRLYSTVSTETTSRTAASETFSIFFSAAVSFSFTTSSAPPAPIRTGTPM